MNYTWQRLEEIASIVREKTGYHAIVAGGAVRDTLHGNEVKDVDILIEKSRDEEDYTDSTTTEHIAGIVALAFGDRAMVTTSLIGYEASSPGDTYATFDVTTDKGEALNLIFVADIEEALNEFPDTISQVWLPGDGTVRMSDGHIDAVRTKAVLHTLDETAGSRGRARLDKLEAKFPDYAFVKVPALDRIEL